MAVTADYLQYVLEQLGGLGRIVPRRMFGAVGLYCEERFFGLIAKDTLYLKVGEGNRAEYEARNMSRFQPYPNKPQLSMTYYEVPADVLEDAESCAEWAAKSLAAARVKAAAMKAPRKTRRAAALNAAPRSRPRRNRNRR